MVLKIYHFPPILSSLTDKYLKLYIYIIVKVQNKDDALVQIKDASPCYDNNPNDPMLLLLDKSDSPSIVEQLSQGPDLVYNTFIDDSS